MKTEVIMKRNLFGMEISQSSKTNMFSATDLVRAGNKFRKSQDLSNFNITLWLNSVSTKDFINELQKKYGKVIIKGRGRSAQTWVHPLLFIDMALAISPKLKVETYEWLFDNLIKFRNDSGDSYKEACASLYTRAKNKKAFPDFISKVAYRIKKVLNVDSWEKASEEDLKKRDKIHLAIKLYSKVLNDNNEIVRLAIKECV